MDWRAYAAVNNAVFDIAVPIVTHCSLLCPAVPCCVMLCHACRAVLCHAVLCCTEAEVVPVRQIDNSAVLSAQLARLASVKQARDDKAVAAALQVTLTNIPHALLLPS
jgi:hypothetical protein